MIPKIIPEPLTSANAAAGAKDPGNGSFTAGSAALMMQNAANTLSAVNAAGKTPVGGPLTFTYVTKAGLPGAGHMERLKDAAGGQYVRIHTEAASGGTKVEGDMTLKLEKLAAYCAAKDIPLPPEDWFGEW
ncbi:MAG: hypothetical protein LBD42_05645 [Desulfovibrio sp.]|jgi:hypothetical protein|nr:hypothetical protein [Desulfovibrio sp.]